MIAITPHMHILLTTSPVDFRKGIDGLASVFRKVLEADPFKGYLFVFVNKKKTSIKILVGVNPYGLVAKLLMILYNDS